MGQKNPTYLLAGRTSGISVLLHGSGHRSLITPLGNLLFDGKGLVVSLATTRANIRAWIILSGQSSIVQQ